MYQCDLCIYKCIYCTVIQIGVRCLTFSEDGKFILSSGVGERYVLFWKIDRSANHSTCCPLPMENPAVSLNCKGSESMDSKDTGLYVLAISEIGLCYFWHGKSIEDMRTSKATKISVSFMHATLRNKGYMPTIYSGKIQSIGNQASGVVLLACGSIVKPSFEKLTVQYGIDVNISSSQEIIFLPAIHLDGSNKDQASKTRGLFHFFFMRQWGIFTFNVICNFQVRLMTLTVKWLFFSQRIVLW